MNLYLNLNLIYNIFHYLFPLFYYKHKNKKYEVYSPFTKKSIYFFGNHDNSLCYYYDYITFKYNLQGQEMPLDFSYTSFMFREENFFSSQFKCRPFKLTKENTDFLQSNIRIK